MNNRKLIITWKPDVFHMYEHNGSYEGKAPYALDEDTNKIVSMYDYSKGFTCRSERESFRNIKSIEKAQLLLTKRNTSQILFATYNNTVIFAST